MVEHHVLPFEGPGPLSAVWHWRGRAGLAQGVLLRAVPMEMGFKGSCAVSDQGSSRCPLFRRLLGRHRESSECWPNAPTR